MINDIKNMSKDVQSKEAEVLYLVKYSATGLLYDFSWTQVGATMSSNFS